MKKLTLLFGLVFIFQTISFSQPCLPQGITFSTQEEIDNFQTNNPNCTEIEGDVEIIGDNITNLNGLSVLTSIGGDLNIWDNAALTSLTGLINVTSIGGYLVIYENDALTSLSGLDNVDSIGGYLGIYNNDALTSLTGLDNVDSIGRYLSIAFNATLISLSSLNNVNHIGGGIYIYGSDSLTSLTGLDNVTSIGEYLHIYNNAALTSLTGLDNIEAGSISELYIYNNISLSTCDVQSICDYLANPNGTILIFDNAVGCNSQQEVEEVCWVGISDIIPNHEFSIYPNPIFDKLFITSNNGWKIETVNIYNQLGQIVLHRNEIRENIDISSLEQGIYIIEITTSELKVRKKLIIKE